MSSFRLPALSISEQVHRWLSTVERSSTTCDQEETYPNATCHRVKRKETRRTQEPVSELLNFKQPGASHEGQHRSTGKEAQIKSRGSAQTQLGPPSDTPSVARPKEGTKRLEDNNVLDASQKYARKQRHKTKPDRYEYKDANEKTSKKRESKTRVKKKSAAPLNHDFQAPNAASERLTLNPNSGPGFLAKAKSSADAAKRKLPDLTFSEMTFLKRKRQEDDALFLKSKEHNLRRKCDKSISHEIAEFFSRPAGMRRKGQYLRKPPSSEFRVSWSVSPLQDLATTMHQRLSSVAQPSKSECIHLHEAHSPTTPSMVRPTSSNGDGFLEKFTTDALLHGVEEFSRGGKRQYSLNDLKKLAAHAASDLTGEEGPRHDDDTVSDVNALNNQLQLSMLPLSIENQVSPQPTRPQLQRNLHQTAEDCNDLRTECPSVHPSNQNRGQPHSGSEKQDVNRTPLPGSAGSRQLVSPTCRPGLFWNGFSEMQGPSHHVCHSENRLGDGELSLCAGGKLELQGSAADSVHPTRPLPANPVVVGTLMNGTEALDAVVGSPSELDEFDRKLLGLGAELTLSASGTMVDRECPLHQTDVERSLRDLGGYSCGSLEDSVADGHRAHDPFGGRGLRNVSMGNSLFHGRQELSQPHRHVSQGPSEGFSGFSGFSRRHVLY